MARLKFHLPFELDARDPNFAHKSASWAFEMECHINELVMRGQETIAASYELMAKVDRLLVRKIG